MLKHDKNSVYVPCIVSSNDAIGRTQVGCKRQEEEVASEFHDDTVPLLTLQTPMLWEFHIISARESGGFASIVEGLSMPINLSLRQRVKRSK